MARKTRRDKEVARLRREVEALRAQLKSESGPKNHHPRDEAVSAPKKERPVIDIRPELKRTAILAAVSLGILFALSLTQPRWSGILK